MGLKHTTLVTRIQRRWSLNPRAYAGYKIEVRRFTLSELRTASTPESLRANIEDARLIRRYAKAMRKKARFPLIEVVKSGAKFLITDGNHRFLAYRSLGGHRTIPAVLIRGQQ